MVRFLQLSIVASVLMIAAMLFSACTAQQQADWKTAHPTTQIVTHAGDVAASATTSAITGNPLPVANSFLSLLSWLLTTPAIAAVPAIDTIVQRRKKAKLSAQLAVATAPWDGRTRRRAKDALPVASKVFIDPFEDFRAKQLDQHAVSVATATAEGAGSATSPATAAA